LRTEQWKKYRKKTSMLIWFLLQKINKKYILKKCAGVLGAPAEFCL
jgi:hypothetical protein